MNPMGPQIEWTSHEPGTPLSCFRRKKGAPPRVFTAIHKLFPSSFTTIVSLCCRTLLLISAIMSTLYADSKSAVKEAVREVKAIPKMAVPAFADISKPANDVRASTAIGKRLN